MTPTRPPFILPIVPIPSDARNSHDNTAISPPANKKTQSKFRNAVRHPSSLFPHLQKTAKTVRDKVKIYRVLFHAILLSLYSRAISASLCDGFSVNTVNMYTMAASWSTRYKSALTVSMGKKKEPLTYVRPSLLPIRPNIRPQPTNQPLSRHSAPATPLPILLKPLWLAHPHLIRRSLDAQRHTPHASSLRRFTLAALFVMPFLLLMLLRPAVRHILPPVLHAQLVMPLTHGRLAA